MGEKKRIQNAYRLTGSSSFYDGMITCSTFPGRVVSRLVWDMQAEEALEYQSRALSGIPKDFAGRLLEVPVGTGILTMPLYQSLPDAKIVCLDYSPEMLVQAQTRARRQELKHVAFHQGDVGALPFEDESFDVVLSLNGFHAFPDKEAAYSETFRVLKPGGLFCGCFYVKGCCRRTDWFIRHVYQRLKFFTPPYETMESLAARLKRMYGETELSQVKGIAVFICCKS
ncbi:MAG: class I SAM-dependent methyltransferase [Bacillota bacterium]|nr:class I SAM-dependent methyltransferase [Bacillota bacterium]